MPAEFDYYLLNWSAGIPYMRGVAGKPFLCCPDMSLHEMCNYIRISHENQTPCRGKKRPVYAYILKVKVVMKLKMDIFLYTMLPSNIMYHLRHSKIGGSNMVNI